MKVSARGMIHLTDNFGNHILCAQLVISGRLGARRLLKSHGQIPLAVSWKLQRVLPRL